MGISPVVFRFEHLRFKINVNDHNPPHVHVEGKGASVRVNLKTLKIMDSKSEFSTSDLKTICDFIEERRNEFIEIWSSYHEED